VIHAANSIMDHQLIVNRQADRHIMYWLARRHIAVRMAPKGVGLRVDQRPLDIPKAVFAAISTSLDPAGMQVFAGSGRGQGHVNLFIALSAGGISNVFRQ
jgi:hypothetical protein